jgi:hypothetical protein
MLERHSLLLDYRFGLHYQRLHHITTHPVVVVVVVVVVEEITVAVVVAVVVVVVERTRTTAQLPAPQTPLAYQSPMTTLPCPARSNAHP